MELFDFSEITARLRCGDGDTLALLKSGAIPRPIVVGGRLLRWPSNSFFGWIGSGCRPCDPPNADEFQQFRDLLFEESEGRKYQARKTKRQLKAAAN